MTTQPDEYGRWTNQIGQCVIERSELYIGSRMIEAQFRCKECHRMNATIHNDDSCCKFCGHDDLSKKSKIKNV